MASSSNPALIYAKPPNGMPVPGQDVLVKNVEPVPSSPPSEGGLLLQVLYASLDPYLRGLLRDPNVKSYFPALPLDAPIQAGTISKVLESNVDGFSKGDLVRGITPIQRTVTIRIDKDSSLTGGLEKLPADAKVEGGSVDLRQYLSALGMPGLTAYSSFYEIGKPKKGETILVSSAAGAVGQVVGALAKIEGLTVIGSVGSDEKAKYITEELGFDAAFNYKKETPYDALKRLAPKGIDIYYENVGGAHLDAAIENMNSLGRIIACGMVSEYNAKTPEERFPHRNLMKMVGSQITMRGFLVYGDPTLGMAYKERHREHVKELLEEGKFKAKIHEYGIEEGDKAFVGMLRGENFGKAVLKVS